MDEFEDEIDPEEREARDGNDDFDFVVGVLENGEVGVDEAQWLDEVLPEEGVVDARASSYDARYLVLGVIDLRIFILQCILDMNSCTAESLFLAQIFYQLSCLCYHIHATFNYLFSHFYWGRRFIEFVSFFAFFAHI